MPAEIKELLYKDFDMTFVAHPVTGDINMLKNHQAITRSVKSLVLASMYDIPYKKSIYGGILAALFENFDPILVRQMQNAIKDVITNWEPRAIYLDSVISEDESLDKNAINVKIYYRPVNAKDPIEVQLILQRIR